MTEQVDQPTRDQDEQESALDKRLDSIGWALFLIMIGGLWLAPKGSIPEGTWLIGTAVIILGMSWVRYLNGITISKFWFVLGILALGSGLSDLLAVDLPVFPILLIIVGASILLKPVFEGKQR